MRMNIKKGLYSAAAAGIACSFSVTAMGATAVSSLFKGAGLLNSGQDQSGEFLIKAPGNTNGTVLQVGDILAGVFFLDSVNSTAIGGATTINELTGVFVTQVTAVDADGISNGTVSGITIEDFEFGPVSGPALAAWAAVGIDPLNFFGAGMPISPGAMVAVFEDVPGDFLSSDFGAGGGAAGGADAVDGTFRGLFGFDGTVGDQFWTATAPADFADIVFGGLFPNDELGAYQFNLDQLAFNGSGWQFAELGGIAGDVELRGNGRILVPDVGYDTGAWGAADDLRIVFKSVPEPTSLALIGLGLVSAGVATRRQQKKA